ncbi:PadR family transcriptional regulator [Streptomyces sp. Midd1]|uniref:PadR family transcriptional regulator n=1 Tax=Streptomyces sp. Midd3 TaxID=3161191 RepID=UPI0034DB5C78
MTMPTRMVLLALDEAGAPTYGYAIAQTTKLVSGTVYPILARLESRGLVTVTEETGRHPGRPPRRYYELTDSGRVMAASSA